MKNLLSLVFAGMVGGGLVLGVSHFTNTSPQIIHNTDGGKAIQVANQSNVNVPFDFVKASAKATPAVVHIEVEESDQLAKERFDNQKKQRRNDPFADFFGGRSMFDDFFGQNFHKQKGSGSGVIISSDGYIVTNNHVVGFGDRIKVVLTDGRELSASKIGTDPRTDLAVIKIEGQHFPFLNYANSDKVQIGEWVLAVGNPFDYLTSTVTAGIVSAKGRDINIIQNDEAIEEFIQTDAVINPGNSGGALVDTDGRLIGINTAIATPTGVYAGYSFAIPSNIVYKIVEKIIEVGDIEKASLGIYFNEIADLKNNGKDVGFDYGAYVEEVINGSSAQFAGVLPGDIIINVNGQEVKSGDDLVESLKFVKVGDTLKLKVIRKGSEKSLKIKMRRGA